MYGPKSPNLSVQKKKKKAKFACNEVFNLMCLFFSISPHASKRTGTLIIYPLQLSLLWHVAPCYMVALALAP